jgi:hypothetical protein
MEPCRFRAVHICCLALVGLSGCASIPLPSEVSIVAVPPAHVCGSHDSHTNVLLNVRNNSRGKLRFAVYSNAGPPYILDGFSYRFLSNGAIDPRLSLGLHHPDVSYLHVIIENGDETQLAVSIFNLEPSDYGKPIQVILTGYDGEYLSTPFLPCILRNDV